MLQYRVLTILDIRRDNDEHGHIARGEGPAGAEIELGLNRLANEGFELVSIGYDANGDPVTIVVRRAHL